MATINPNLEKLSLAEIESISDRYLMGWHDLEKEYGFRIKGLNNKRCKFGLEPIDKNVSMEYRLKYIKSHYSDSEIEDAVEDCLKNFRLAEMRWKGIELLDCRFGRDYVKAFRSLIGSSAYRKLSEKYRVDKLSETQINVYGGIGLANPDAKRKAEATNQKFYGVSNPMRCDEIQQRLAVTNLQKYGGSSPFCSESIRKKALKKKEKKFHEQIDKFKQSGLIKDIKFMSPNEEQVFCLLLEKFGKCDFYYQYGIHPYDKRYPYHCDFYIKSLDLFIELNCHYSHHTHWFDANNHDDLLRKQHLSQSHSKKSVNSLKTWCETDVIKRQTAKDNKLKYLVFWNNDLSDFYRWFFEYDCNIEKFIKDFPKNTY